MIRWLRLLAWVRWRGLYQQLRRASGRGVGVRISQISQAIVPFLALALLLPGYLALMAIGLVGGWALAGGEIAFARYLLPVRIAFLAYLVGLLLVPLLLGSRSAAAPLRRLLLLPVGRRQLHALGLAAGIADPLLLSAALPLATFSFGLLVGGRPGVALVAAVGGLLLVVASAAILASVAAILKLVLRRRRRAEALAVAGIFLLTSLAAIPVFLVDEPPQSELAGPEPPTGPEAVEPTREAGGETFTIEVSPFSSPLFTALWWVDLPAELYLRAVGAADGGRLAALAWLTGLAAVALLLFRLSEAVYGRLLTVTVGGGSGASRGRAERPPRRLELAGVSAPVAAIALVQMRVYRRTIFGRLALLVTPLTVGILAGGLSLAGDRFLPTGSLDLLLVCAGTGLVFLNLNQFMFNQYAVDGAGGTLLALQPASARQVVEGKAMAWGLVGLLYFPLVVVPTLLIVRPAPLTALADVTLAALLGISLWLWSAPLAALLSAAFPKAVDMSRLSNQAQPHPLAAFGGLFVIGGALGVPALLVLGVHGLGGSLRGAPVFALLILWTAVSLAGNRLLVGPAADVLEKRHEEILLATAAR